MNINHVDQIYSENLKTKVQFNTLIKNKIATLKDDANFHWIQYVHRLLILEPMYNGMYT